jgi:hypothetical protein
MGNQIKFGLTKSTLYKQFFYDNFYSYKRVKTETPEIFAVISIPCSDCVCVSFWINVSVCPSELIEYSPSVGVASCPVEEPVSPTCIS